MGNFFIKEVEFPLNTLVTITWVEADQGRGIRRAIVWISVLPEEKEKEVLEILKKNLYDIQGEVNKKVASHPAPRVSFKVDKGLSYSAKIEKITKDLDE